MPGWDSPAAGAGRVRVYSGDSPLFVVQIAAVQGDGVSDFLGTSVAGLGDIDLDGYADYAAGAPGLNANSTTGYVKIVSGKTTTTIERIVGSAGEGLGIALSAASDSDADGLPDLVVGGAYDDSHGTDSGVAWLYSLRPMGTWFYGTSDPGCNGPHLLTASSPPKLGNANFGYRANAAPPSSLGLLLATDSQDVAGSDPFGIGIALYVDFFAASEIYGLDFLTDGAGYAGITTALASNPAILGLDYYLQAIFAFPLGACSLPPFNLSSSQGLKIVIH